MGAPCFWKTTQSSLHQEVNDSEDHEGPLCERLNSSNKRRRLDSDQPKWAEQFSALSQKFGVSNENLKPWTDMPGVKFDGLQRITPRVAALVNLAVFSKLGPSTEAVVETARKTGNWKPIQKAMSGVLIDLSQNPCRQAWTNHEGVAKCLTTGSSLYSFDCQRMLLPPELLYLQGHRRAVVIPKAMTGRSVSTLAGEGIFLPCLGTILHGLICSHCLAAR